MMKSIPTKKWKKGYRLLFPLFPPMLLLLTLTLRRTAVMHMYTTPTARVAVITSRGGSSTNAATTATPHRRSRSSRLSRAAAASSFQDGDHPGT